MEKYSCSNCESKNYNIVEDNNRTLLECKECGRKYVLFYYCVECGVKFYNKFQDYNLCSDCLAPVHEEIHERLKTKIILYNRYQTL